jgi:hypothetical protein
MIRRLTLVVALLAGTPAQAQVPKQDKSKPPAEAVLPNLSANYILPFCVGKEQVPPNSNYEMRGYCAGMLYALSTELGDMKAACVPDGVTVDQAKRVVVKYMSARPERTHEYFIVLAEEAIKDAWPCK